MKNSEKISLGAIALGAGVAAGLYWLAPELPWWVYAIVGTLSAGAAYDQWLKLAANKRLADRDDPDKR